MGWLLWEASGGYPDENADSSWPVRPPLNLCENANVFIFRQPSSPIASNRQLECECRGSMASFEIPMPVIAKMQDGTYFGVTQSFIIIIATSRCSTRMWFRSSFPSFSCRKKLKITHTKLYKVAKSSPVWNRVAWIWCCMTSPQGNSIKVMPINRYWWRIFDLSVEGKNGLVPSSLYISILRKSSIISREKFLSSFSADCH